jgi:hypothetical protein
MFFLKRISFFGEIILNVTTIFYDFYKGLIYKMASKNAKT